MPYPRVAREVELRFWSLLRDRSVSAAAVTVGVSANVGYLWVAQRGGVAPAPRAAGTGRRRLYLADREEIAIGLALGRSIRQIAAALQVAPSTVSREVRANGPSRGGGPYRAAAAAARADAHARRPKRTKLAGNAGLRARVQRQLLTGWSPEQISARLRIDWPDDERMRISPETIYRELYVQTRGALRRDLRNCLRTGRAVRKPRRRSEVPGPIAEKVLIGERPAEVDERSIAGHWEGDLILGTANASAVGTLVERTTRYTLLLPLPHRHGALEVRDAIIAAVRELPPPLLRSLTWDQGIEMAAHRQLAELLAIAVYFCDPHSPWQRGTNENTNGLLRQYLPKGTDLSVHTPADLRRIQDRLNTRPRKTLNWATPAEALAALQSTH